jgi:hypothetical protein
LSSGLTTIHGTHIDLTSIEKLGNGSHSFAGVPAANLSNTDVAELTATTGTGLVGLQTVGVYLNGVTDQSLDFGPSLGTPTVADSEPWYDRPHVILPSQALYNRAMTAEFSEYYQLSQGRNHYASITVSRNYYGRTPEVWDLQFPNLHGVKGWDDRWGLQQTHASNYAVTAYGGPVLMLDGPPTPGTHFFRASHLVGSGYATASRSRADMLRPQH